MFIRIQLFIIQFGSNCVWYTTELYIWMGAGITQSVVCWARCPAWCSGMGSILLLASSKGDFSLGINMGSDSIPQKTLSDESINRGLVCARMHSIAQAQKIQTFMSCTGECKEQEHTQYAPSKKTECDYLNGWINTIPTYIRCTSLYTLTWAHRCAAFPADVQILVFFQFILQALLTEL